MTTPQPGKPTGKKYSEEELAKLGIRFDATGARILDDGVPVVEPVSASEFAELARSEKFMNEVLAIRIATTTDANAPPYVSITINDVHNRVVVGRGIVTRVRRCHVEVLARMRETRYTQPVRNPADPESGNFLIPHHAMIYPFEVVEDPNPVGRAWLERVLAEPTY